MTGNPYKVSDPVMDAAQGRPMIVLEAPDETVAEWSDRNDYDLVENYGNAKFDPDPDEPVVRCAYLGNVRSEPSKDYTFPVSRVVLIDAHHADDGRRLYDRVVVDVLERLFSHRGDPAGTYSIAQSVGFDPELIDEARELADVEATIPVDDADEVYSGAEAEARGIGPGPEDDRSETDTGP